ncbi:N-acetyltransferase family protein [Ornithinimicrobium sp. Y1847]|uniref:GNAT family N-acetyltransferase n=1 Tax=unclassified Ornithinimicrobium TaxID=2615080 RepID=UPI003B684D6D
MSAAAYLIRRPTRSDTVPFSTLHAEIWRATYRGVMEDRIVDALEPASFAATWMAVGSGYDEGTIPDDGRGFWVATLEEEPVGFIFFGPPRDEDPPQERQLFALNVHPDHHGSGLAGRLMDEGFGSGPAYLWVAKGNGRAIRFYERNGFVLDGTESTDQHDGVVELRMVRSG